MLTCRRKSISLPLNSWFLVCLAYLLYTNKWRLLKLYYLSTIVTDLWSRKIAQRGISAIKSNYFLKASKEVGSNACSIMVPRKHSQPLPDHQPSFSPAHSLGSRGSGCGTKEEMEFALKLVEYRVPIDGISYYFLVFIFL